MDDDKKSLATGKLAVHPSPHKRYLFMIAGHLSVVAGVIGLLLPIVPTMPFVLLAAYCYARSSERLYLMLLNNKYFGKGVRDWEEYHCVQRKVKISIMIMLLVMFSLTAFLFFEELKVRALIGVLALIAISSVAFLSVCENKKGYMK